MQKLRIACGVVMAVAAMTALASAQGPITVFSGGAMQEPVKAAGEASKTRLSLVVDTTGALQKRLTAGGKADLIVVTSAAIDALEKANLVVKGTKIDLARGLIGVGVKAG